MRAFSAFALCLVLATSAQAQQTEASADRPAFVQYTMEALFQSEVEAPYSHPILEKLALQPHLTTLNAEDMGSAMRLRAVLSFGSLELFRQWYAAPETQALMQQLSDTPASSLKTSLAVQRLPGSASDL